MDYKTLPDLSAKGWEDDDRTFILWVKMSINFHAIMMSHKSQNCQASEREPKTSSLFISLIKPHKYETKAGSLGGENYSLRVSRPQMSKNIVSLQNKAKNIKPKRLMSPRLHVLITRAPGGDKVRSGWIIGEELLKGLRCYRACQMFIANPDARVNDWCLMLPPRPRSSDSNQYSC